MKIAGYISVPHQLSNSMAAIIAPPQKKDEQYHSEVFHFRIVMNSIVLGLLSCYYLPKCLFFIWFVQFTTEMSLVGALNPIPSGRP